MTFKSAAKEVVSDFAVGLLVLGLVGVFVGLGYLAVRYPPYGCVPVGLFGIWVVGAMIR